MLASRKQLSLNFPSSLRLKPKSHTKTHNFSQLINFIKLKEKKSTNKPSLAHRIDQHHESVMSGGEGGGGGGPCGACKFLRRKCVKGCIFAPYFDSDQGAAHFAAVHKVFGASNASKLLHRLPPPKRLDACVTLCYEALARVRDPVYGCVSQIFSLQQQVVNMQAELAYIQAKLSTLQRLFPPSLQSPSPTTRNPPLLESIPGSDVGLLSNVPMLLDPFQTQLGCNEMTNSFLNPIDFQDQMDEDGDLQSLAREFVTRYLPGVRFRPPCSQI